MLPNTRKYGKLSLNSVFHQYKQSVNTLAAMKFPERFIKWIEMCFTSPKFPIAFNGFLVGYFQDRLYLWQISKKGWQGDLLCVFCRNQCETRDHLFIECFFSSRIWRRVVCDCLRQQVCVHWHKVIKWNQ